MRLTADKACVILGKVEFVGTRRLMASGHPVDALGPRAAPPRLARRPPGPRRARARPPVLQLDQPRERGRAVPHRRHDSTPGSSTRGSTAVHPTAAELAPDRRTCARCSTTSSSRTPPGDRRRRRLARASPSCSPRRRRRSTADGGIARRRAPVGAERRRRRSPGSVLAIIARGRTTARGGDSRRASTASGSSTTRRRTAARDGAR